MKSILSIGDVHGLTEWSIPTFGGINSFYKWQSNPKNDNSYPLHNFDKIIFVADYCDSFREDHWIKCGLSKEEAKRRDRSNVEILHNLKNIIEFKRAYPDKVVLLIGNHDVQYITAIGVKHSKCAGLRAEAHHDLHSLFLKNIDLFQVAYQYKDWLWTHAGLTKAFLVNCLETMKHENYRFYSSTKDMSIVELLNFMLEANNIDLYNCGYSSQGSSPFPSPIWARIEDLDNDPIHLNQVVGHTHTNDIITYESPTRFEYSEEKREWVLTGPPVNHIYIDCLSEKKWLIQNI